MKTADEARILTEENRIKDNKDYLSIVYVIDEAIKNKVGCAVYKKDIDDDMFYYLKIKGYEVVKDKDINGNINTIIYWS